MSYRRFSKLLLALVPVLLLAGIILFVPTRGPSPPVRAASAPPAPLAPEQVAALDSQLFYFEPNQGQAQTASPFVARGMGGTLFVHAEGITLTLPLTTSRPPEPAPTATLGFRLANTNPDVQITGTQRLPGTVNYYVGSDDRQWRSKVPAYAELRYTSLYTGVDMVVAGAGATTKLRFDVAPLGDPTQIRWRYAGADEVTLDPDTGDIRVTFAAGQATLIDTAPVAWQPSDQERTPVPVTYTLNADGSIGLELGAYNPDLPLLIDPTLAYGTFWGGGAGEAGVEIALDGANNACITGDTTSFAPGGFNDVFVSCFDANGQWLYTTLVGGNSYEGGADLNFDAAGRLYVTGPTWSSNFPALSGPAPYGSGDAFVLQLNGGAMVNSVMLGGSALDMGFSVAPDAAGDLYVVGRTASADFSSIVTATALYPTIQGQIDLFVVKLDDAFSLPALYGSFIGGSADDCDFYQGCHVAVDDANGVYLTGNTDSADFPTLNALFGFNGGGTLGWAAEAFVTHLEWTGGQLNLIYSTFLGGTGYEESYGIAVDSLGRPVVVGTTSSADYPTTAFALQPAFGGGDRDVYVSKLAWDGANLSLFYSTYLGGSGTDQANDVTVHPGTNAAYLTGYTNSPNFPTHDPLFASISGGMDVFVTGIASNGMNFHYSTYLGGSDRDGGNGIAVDAGCDAYLTGGTASADFPTQNAWNPLYQGSGDAFVTRLNESCPVTIGPEVNDLTLNPGDTFTEVITVTIPGQSETCVLDVYFLADTTGSMGTILNTVRNSASTMLDQIQAQLPHCDVAFGVGNYKDFPNDPFGFQHQVSLTSTTTTVQTGINAWTASGGFDAPEAQLYALYKVGQDNAGSIGWRAAATQRMVVWFGDQPGHDPVCQSIHGDATVPLDVALLDAANELNGANVQVIAVDTNNLDGTAFANDYTGCTGNGSMVAGNQAQFLATWTSGSYQAGINATTVVSTIVNQVVALSPGVVNSVTLTSTGSIPGFVTSITPAGGYGPLDPTITHTLPFTVTFTGTQPCTTTEQVFTGTLDVVVDGEVVAAKPVTITVPPCVCVEPPPGMVAWWTLDELSGIQAFDIVGGHTGYHAGGPVPISGQVDAALSFDGVNDFVRVPNAPPLNFGPSMTGTDRGDFSIDAWIYWDTFTPKEMPIVAKWDRERGYYFFILDGQLSLVLADGAGANHYFAVGAPTVPDGQWTHVAVTVDRDDPDGISFYVDGALTGTRDPTGRPGSLMNGAPLTIGGTPYTWLPGNWAHFLGDIDEVELFKRELSAGEVAAIYGAYSAGKCKPEPSPDLAVRKRAVGDFVIGGVGSYIIDVTNVGSLPATGTITVQDTLPAGFVAPIAAGGSGWSCSVAGLTVTCTHPGPLAVGDNLPPLVIHAAIGDAVEPESENCATVTHPADPFPGNDATCIITEVGQPDPDIPRSDLGDAPASNNHDGSAMTTYGSVAANFPTVFGVTPPGPFHAQPQRDAWLGIGVTGEQDADLLPDADGVTNIDPPGDLANRDRFDDGVQLNTVRLPRCGFTRFAYDVSVNGGAGDRYLNVWIDFNRDGDFEDVVYCRRFWNPFPLAVPEWAVSNHLVSLTNGYHTGLLTPNFRAYRASFFPFLTRSRWMRISLSEQAAPAPGDGRGPASGYRLGETEDYLLRFRLRPIPVDPVLRRHVLVENTLGFSDTIRFPSGAVTRELTVTYGAETTPTTLPSGAQPLGVNFSLEAYAGDDFVPDLRFEKPVSVTLRYDEGVPAAALLRATAAISPVLYVRSDAGWVEAACGSYVYDRFEGQLTVPICRTGDFALLADEPDYRIYLPLVLRE